MGAVSVRPSKSVISVVLMVFVTVPGVVELTQTVRVQVAPAAIPRVGWVGLVQLMLLAPVVAVSVPPWQAAFFVAGVLVPPAFLLVIVTPVGRLSVIATLDRLVSEGAMILMVRRVFVPGRMLGVPNVLLPVIGRVEALTVIVAVLLAPALHTGVETLLTKVVPHAPPAAMLLLIDVAVGLVTLKVTVQLPEAGIVPLVSVTVLGEPVESLTTPGPQFVLSAGVAYSTNGEVRVSVMDTPVMAVVVAFVSLIVTREGFPAVMLVGENVFARVRAPVMFRAPLKLVGLVTCWSSCRLSAGMVFVRVCVPRVTGVVTVKVSRHWPGVKTVPAGMVPPVSVTELAVNVTVPPHCGEIGVPETVMLAGKGSVRLTLV